MRTLVIETATEACSIALFEGGEEVAHDHRVLGRGHAETLVPMIADLPGKGRAERILVSLGPGSFTGVRIGIATARALGFAWSAHVLGYPTLALVAAMAEAEGAPEVTVCMTGGHGEWFVADMVACTGDRIAQAVELFLPDEMDVGHVGNVSNALQQLILTLLGQFLFQLKVAVEVFLDGAFGFADAHHDVGDA